MFRFCLGIALCVALGLWWSHHSGYRAGVAACQASTHKAADEERREHQARLAEAASIQTHITHLGDIQVADSIQVNHDTVHTIIRTVQAHPAPADCVASPGVVQKLQSAVDQANAAAGPLRSQPASATTAGHP